jgi:CubicO group peptidase (beta-lactamase class C family)
MKELSMTYELRDSLIKKTSVLMAYTLCLLFAALPLVALAQAKEAETFATASNDISVKDFELARGLRSYTRDLAARDQFSGVVLFAKNGRPLFAEAFGFANRAFHASNRLDTKFNLASVGKIFTSVAIMQMIEQGKLSVDARLIDVVPDYPDVDAASRITVRHLLQHRSGLDDYFGEKFDSNLTGLKTLRDYVPLFAAEPLRFEPGTQFLYSNAGFLVLGLAIEHLTIRGYYEYVTENLFAPAGMTATNTGFFCAFDDEPNLAIGYTTAPVFGYPPVSPGSPRRPVVTLTRGTSAGGVFSTAGDLLKFSEALRTHKLLTKESLDLMLTGGYGVLAGPPGARVRNMGGGGSVEGGSTYFEMYPDLGYTLVVLSNIDDASLPLFQWLHRRVMESERRNREPG